jgi:hypothetical protein
MLHASSLYPSSGISFFSRMFSTSDDKGIFEKNTAKKAYDIFNQNMEVVKSASA